jgi:hypothetical protein
MVEASSTTMIRAGFSVCAKIPSSTVSSSADGVLKQEIEIVTSLERYILCLPSRIGLPFFGMGHILHLSPESVGTFLNFVCRIYNNYRNIRQVHRGITYRLSRAQSNSGVRIS